MRTVDSRIELGEGDQETEVIELEPYIADALRLVSLLKQKQGGCTIIPREYSVSADNSGFSWNMSAVKRVAKSSEEFVPGNEDDLANLFGKIMIGLRAGRRIVVDIKKYPIIT